MKNVLACTQDKYFLNPFTPSYSHYTGVLITSDANVEIMHTKLRSIINADIIANPLLPALRKYSA